MKLLVPPAGLRQSCRNNDLERMWDSFQALFCLAFCPDRPTREEPNQRGNRAMAIVKQAGEFQVEASEGGWPIWISVEWSGWKHQGEEHKFFGLRLDDVKDLHYCLSEVIAKVSKQEEIDSNRGRS